MAAHVAGVEPKKPRAGNTIETTDTIEHLAANIQDNEGITHDQRRSRILRSRGPHQPRATH